jgi:hypothetical protein
MGTVKVMGTVKAMSAVKGTIHILNEAASPTSAMTSTMWCGIETIELFNGSFVPETDFFVEAQAEFATCVVCKRAFESRVVRL